MNYFIHYFNGRVQIYYICTHFQIYSYPFLKKTQNMFECVFRNGSMCLNVYLEMDLSDYWLVNRSNINNSI